MRKRVKAQKGLASAGFPVPIVNTVFERKYKNNVLPSFNIMSNTPFFTLWWSNHPERQRMVDILLKDNIELFTKVLGPASFGLRVEYNSKCWWLQIFGNDFLIISSKKGTTYELVKLNTNLENFQNDEILGWACCKFIDLLYKEIGKHV